VVILQNLVHLASDQARLDGYLRAIALQHRALLEAVSALHGPCTVRPALQ
jgi:hypothetical protein